MYHKIRLPSEPDLFAVTGRELRQLARGLKTPLRDYCIALAPASFVFLFNAAIEISNQAGGQSWRFSVEMFLNCVFGLSLLFVSLAFGVVWRRQEKGKDELLDEIKARRPLLLTQATMPKETTEELVAEARPVVAPDADSMKPVSRAV